MTESMILSFKENRPVHLLANTLSSDRDKRALFVDYFQDKSSNQDGHATQNQIVAILNQSEEKQNAFFTALDDIFQQKSFTKAHYGPIEDIVISLQEASIDIYDKVSSLANNSTWGVKLLNLLHLNDEADSFYESFLGSSSNSEVSAIEDPQEAPVILKFPQNKAS
jgi:hypothetical protein